MLSYLQIQRESQLCINGLYEKLVIKQQQELTFAINFLSFRKQKKWIFF